MFISALLIHKHTTFVHPVLLQEASELSSLLPHLRAAEYKLYAVVHEKRGVEEFRPFFKGDIFLDEEVRLLSADNGLFGEFTLCN